jgi:hypothetical protein
MEPGSIIKKNKNEMNGTSDAKIVTHDAAEKVKEKFYGSRWIAQMRRGEERCLNCDFVWDKFLLVFNSIVELCLSEN